MTGDPEVVVGRMYPPPDAVREYAALTSRLARLDTATPCAGRLEWVSPNPIDQAFARRLCEGCPLLLPCGRYGQKAKPHGCTYGGITYVARKAREGQSPTTGGASKLHGAPPEDP